MTLSLKTQNFFKVFLLVKQEGMNLIPVGLPSSNFIGTGFYMSKQDAEYAKTIEYLKNTIDNIQLHIFELDVPNPIRKI